MPKLTAADVAHLKAGTSVIIRAASAPGTLYQWSGTLAGPLVTSPYGRPAEDGDTAPLWLGPVLIRDAAGKPGPELVEVIEPKPDGPTVPALVGPATVTYRLTEAGRRALNRECGDEVPDGWGCTEPDGHAGDHIARGSVSAHIYARWPRVEVDERARCMAAHPAGKHRAFPDEDGGTIYAGRR